MELKSIQIPEGYHAEIDNEKRVVNIVKNEERKPAQSWEEYCLNTSRRGKFWIRENGDIVKYGSEGTEDCSNLNPKGDIMSVSSKEKGEAIVALCQLMLLHEDWVGDFDYKEYLAEGYCTFQINIFQGKFDYTEEYDENYWLIFPDEDMCQDFMKQFSDLLEKAKYLL